MNSPCSSGTPDCDFRRERVGAPEQRARAVVPAFGGHVAAKEFRLAQPTSIRHHLAQTIELDARIRQRERRHHVHLAASPLPLARAMRIRRRQDLRRVPGRCVVDVAEVRDAGVVRQELVEDRQQRAPEFVDVDAGVQPQQQGFEARIIERRPGSARAQVTRRSSPAAANRYAPMIILSSQLSVRRRDPTVKTPLARAMIPASGAR